MPRVYIGSTESDDVEIATIVGIEQDGESTTLTLIVESTEEEGN